MNKLCFLKEMMNPIVEKCLDKYGGGESYFTEIDAMIKSCADERIHSIYHRKREHI